MPEWVVVGKGELLSTNNDRIKPLFLEVDGGHDLLVGTYMLTEPSS